jgi:threonine dehydratase
LLLDGDRLAAARSLLGTHFGPTPLVQARSLSGANRIVFLKNETVLPTGSFKVRGAIHALFAKLQLDRIGEVVAASTGNHGAAVAYAGQLLGVPARIFLPLDSNPVKIARIREAGAEVVEVGTDLTGAIDAAAAYATRTSAFFLHDASDPDIPVGTATIGAEIAEQCPSANAVYIPMGDTALIRGVAAVLRLVRPAIHIVGVVAAEAPAYFLSWQAGRVIETDSAATIADGLAVRRPLAPNVDAIRRLADEIVTVTEREMLEAIARLRDEEKIVAEPSGAASVAALMNEKREGTSVALITGRNISPKTM